MSSIKMTSDIVKQKFSTTYYFVAIVLFFGIAAALAFSFLPNLNQIVSDQNTTNIASFGSIENSNFSVSEMHHMGVGRRNLGLKFNLYGSSSRTIVARVELPKNLNLQDKTLKYKWSLDSGIELQKYSLEGEILIPANQKTFEIPIEVSGFSEASAKFLRFEAKVQADQHQFFTDGIVSSTERSSFEAFVQGIEDFKKREKLHD